jgi:autotransporter-associated beta strand protein
MTLNSKTLTILSGGILAYGVASSNPYTGVNDATRGTITSGTSGPSELVITKMGGNFWMNIGATIVDNAGGGSVSLVLNNNTPTSYGITLYSAANSYSGDTIVNSGYLATSSVTSEVIPNGVGKGNVIVNTGGLLGLNNETINGLSGVGTVSLGTDKTVKVGDNNATSAFSGTITGAGALQKIGAGTLTLTGTNNTYSGGTTISNGVLAIAKTNLLGTGTIALSGGILSNTVAMTSGLGLANTINLTSVGTLDTSAGNLLLTGAITNNGSMTKAGANGLLIYGAKTGTGALTVSAGYLGGTNVWAGTVTNLAMITAADTNTIGSLTVSNLVLAADSTLLWNYDNTNYDVIHVAGTLTLPDVATVQVSRVSGKLPPLATLATYRSLAGSSTLQNWKVVGDSVQPRTYVRLNNNEVQLVSPAGTLISIF